MKTGDIVEMEGKRYIVIDQPEITGSSLYDLVEGAEWDIQYRLKLLKPDGTPYAQRRNLREIDQAHLLKGIAKKVESSSK